MWGVIVMVTSKPVNSLWVKILFETPEYIHELISSGVFPEKRKKVIDLTTKILLICQRRKTGTAKLVENVTFSIVEWINDHWGKKINR